MKEHKKKKIQRIKNKKNLTFSDRYTNTFSESTIFRMMKVISYAASKRDCNETMKITSWEDPAWEITDKDSEKNDTSMKFVIKGVYDKRFFDMSVSDSEFTRGNMITIESESGYASVNLTKTDRIKIYNAHLLSFKNAFNAAIIGDPIIFEANENTTYIKNVFGTVNLMFDGTMVTPNHKYTFSYNLRRSQMVFKYFIDFEVDEDSSIVTKGHCSNTETRTISLTKFLDENPDVFPNLDTFGDNIKLEKLNGTYVLRNIAAKQIFESVIMAGYSCCH